MKPTTQDWKFLEEICKEDELDVSFFSIEFPDGSLYEYKE